MGLHFLNVSNPNGENIGYEEDGTLSVRLVAAETCPFGSDPIIQRSSPIFPMNQDSYISNSFAGKWNILFLCPTSPFSFLGKANSGALDIDPDELWFGIGSASVIVITNSDICEGFVETLAPEEHYGWELWKIENGQILDTSLRKYPEMEACEAVFDKFPNYSSLPRETTSVIDEFLSSFECVINQARRYNCSELPGLHMLMAQAGGMTEEIICLYEKNGELPGSLKVYAAAALEEDDILRTQLIHQRRDRLVQISSALSYVASQCVSGSPPILQNPAIIRRHRLLGVGTAQRAIGGLVREIESLIYGLPVTDVIRKEWDKPGKLPDFESCTTCDPRAWETVCNVDLHIDDMIPGIGISKLTHFSGRLGFRESEFAISAAMQALAAGDSLEWHIATMTHEILHGYVRAIIAAIFSVEPELFYRQKDSIGFEIIYKKFSEHMKGNMSDEFSMKDSARSIILSYCCLVPELGSLSSLPNAPVTKTDISIELGAFVLPVKRTLLGLFQSELRNISEIMVHVLDYLYFYNGDPRTFVTFVWLSWAVVPIVNADVRQYVLRTLFVLASTIDGGQGNRFKEAVRTAIGLLEEAEQRVGETAVLKQAIILLKESSNSELDRSESLMRPFIAGLRIVDFTSRVLRSKKLKTKMYSDNVTVSETGLEFNYEFEAGEFRDRKLNSRSEFIAWRVRSAVERKNSLNDVERQTAWMYLACSK